MKLLVLDIEGTIFESVRLPGTSISSTVWQGIAKVLGPEVEKAEVQTHARWHSGKSAGYLDWMKATIELHREFGLTQSNFFRVVNGARYRPGVKSGIDAARNLGFEPVLVSGGFRELARRAQVDLGIVHAFAACEYFFDASDRIVGYNLLPCDFAGKIDFIRLLLSEYRLGQSDWVFVGDGLNDAPIAKEAPYAIAISGHPQLQVVCDEKIESFYELLPALERAARVLDVGRPALS